MPYSEEDDFAYMLEHVGKRQRKLRAPKPISQPIQRLLTRYGLANFQERTAWERVLKQAVGGALSDRCRPGRYRGGVLEVIVGNSASLQELTFQKRRVINKLGELLPEFRVRDIRFRIGEIA